MTPDCFRCFNPSTAFQRNIINIYVMLLPIGVLNLSLLLVVLHSQPYTRYDRIWFQYAQTDRPRSVQAYPSTQYIQNRILFIISRVQKQEQHEMVWTQNGWSNKHVTDIASSITNCPKDRTCDSHLTSMIIKRTQQRVQPRIILWTLASIWAKLLVLSAVVFLILSVKSQYGVIQNDTSMFVAEWNH